MRPFIVGVAAVSIVAFCLLTAAAEPQIVPRGGKAGWGAKEAKYKRIPPIKEIKTRARTVLAENELNARGLDEIEFLTVHSTTIPARASASLSEKMKALQQMVQNGYDVTGTLRSYMADIPYHYVVLRDGKIAEGREIKFPAQTNTRDSPYGRSIGKHLTVVLEQQLDRDSNGRPRLVDGQLQTLPPTDEQLAALTELLQSLARKHNIRADKIGYHSQYASTSCPGPHIINEFPRIISELQKKGL